jgi:hypothetical protein
MNANDYRAKRAKLAADRGLASYQNRPNARGGRWIERPAMAGLRFVGFADKLARLVHMGWFLSPDGDDGEVARGCVYQLPARGGRPVYVEAYQLGSESRKSGWLEQSSGLGERDAPAVVFLADRHLGELGGTGSEWPYDDEKAQRDAARGADREAEIVAEHEREWREASELGRTAAEAIEEASEARSEARELLAEIRGRTVADMPATCKAIRGEIARLLRSARRKHDKARELWEEHAGETRAFLAHIHGAFEDGAGYATYLEARRNG